MISKKNIVILSVVLTLLIGAFVAVNFLWIEDDGQDIGTDIETIEVFSELSENVKRIDARVDGEKFSFACKDGQWSVSGKNVKVENHLISSLCSELTSIYAYSCVEQNPDNLDKYGLEKPFAEYKLTLSNDTEKTFLLGNQDPVTGYYYFKDSDASPVYTIYSSKGDTLSQNFDYYRDKSILNVSAEGLSRIYVKKGAQVLELEKFTEVVNEQETEKWKMLKPMARNCDTNKIEDNIISKISYITFEEFVDAEDEKYSLSGVSNPVATVKLTDDSGAEQTIYIGKKEGNLRYIKTNSTVYLVNDDSVNFVDIDPFIYISKFINLENIEKVSKVEVTHKDKTHVITIEGEKEKAVYKLNGREVLEETFKEDVYQKVIGLLADGFAKNPKYSIPEYSLTFYFKDGSVKKTDYCHYDERSYAAFDKNKKCDFVILKKELENMFSAIEKIAK